MVIRPEAPADRAAVDRVNRDAFGRSEEARLVDLLRRASVVIASLVAVDDADQVVGHILFSPATILTASNELQVASLAPMAVAPALQRRGIGSMLVEAGLSNREVADRLFVSVRTVEGHLYRIFAKLGIDDRDQLVHLLRLDRSGA